MGLLAQMGIAPLHRGGVVLNLGTLIQCLGKCFLVVNLSRHMLKAGLCSLSCLPGTSCNLSCQETKFPSLLKKLPVPMRNESPAVAHAVTPSCSAPSQLSSPDCPVIILVAHLADLMPPDPELSTSSCSSDSGQCLSPCPCLACVLAGPGGQLGLCLCPTQVRPHLENCT